MVENHNPRLFGKNPLIPDRNRRIHSFIVGKVNSHYFEIDFEKQQNPLLLQSAQEQRNKVLETLSNVKVNGERELTPDELSGLQISTYLAGTIDMIYYHKLHKNEVGLSYESEELKHKIDRLLGEDSEYKGFFSHNRCWVNTLKFIKEYALYQEGAWGNSQNMYEKSSVLAKTMGQSIGPRLFFLPDEEDLIPSHGKLSRSNLVPQLIYALPISEEGFTHPLQIKHGHLYYNHAILQAGSALKWELSGIAIDGGALIFINNFIGNYKHAVSNTITNMKKYGINGEINTDIIWQYYLDFLLLHEIGHSNFYSLRKSMVLWAEWLADNYMYKEIISIAKEKTDAERKKILLMLMVQAELTKKRLKDSDTTSYIRSELLFLHFLIKSGLVFPDDLSFNVTYERLDLFTKLIGSCKKRAEIISEEAEINSAEIIRWWQTHFTTSNEKES